MQKKVIIRAFTTALFISASFIIGCSSTSNNVEKTYYVLKNNDNTDATQISGTPNVSLRKVKLPSYLNQQGIVRLLSNGKINISSKDLWAEKLSQSVPTILIDHLSVKLQNPVEQHPLPPGVRVDTVIEVNIEQFIGNEQKLHLKGSYRLVNPGSLKTYKFSKVKTLDNNQTSTLVDAYYDLVTQLSYEIATNL